MKKIICIAFLQCFLLASCNRVDPVGWNTRVVTTYNNTIISIEDLEEMISIELIGDSATIEQIQDKSNQVLNSINQEINMLNTEEIPDDAEQYQASTLAYLESTKQLIQTGLQFTQLTEETPDLDIEEYANKYDSLSIITSEKAKRVEKAQQQFLERIK